MIFYFIDVGYTFSSLNLNLMLDFLFPVFMAIVTDISW